MIESQIRDYITKLREWGAQQCRVCGGKMTFAASSREGTKYVCRLASDGVLKYKWGTKEEKENSEHYHKSETWDTKISTASTFLGIANDLEKILVSTKDSYIKGVK